MQHVTIEGRLRSHPVVIPYPGEYAGKPIAESEVGSESGYEASLGATTGPWYPFKTKMEWEIAQWAKLRGPGATAFNEFLHIDGVSVLCSRNYDMC